MRCKSVLVCLAVVMAGASLAGAATLNVGPARTYTTVQSAINAAVDGDTILIDPGTYTGPAGTMVIETKNNLTIKANGGPVILDQGGPANSVWGKGLCNIVGGSTNIAFEGLTLINGQVRASDPGLNGAGIAWDGYGLLRVTNCVIRDCEHALRVLNGYGSDVLIENSEIYNCGGTGNKMAISSAVAEGRLNSFTMQYCRVSNNNTNDLMQVSARVIKILYNQLGDGYVDGAWKGGGRVYHNYGGGLTYLIGNQITRGDASGSTGTLLQHAPSYTTYSNVYYVINNTFVSYRGGSTTALNVSGNPMASKIANNVFVTFNNIADTFCTPTLPPSLAGSNIMVWRQTSGNEQQKDLATGTIINPAPKNLNMVNLDPVLGAIDVHVQSGMDSIVKGVGLTAGGGVLPATGGDTLYPQLGQLSLGAPKQYKAIAGSENRLNQSNAGMYGDVSTANLAPIVTAGASGVPVGVTYPNRAVSQLGGMLMGAASDDGLPAGSSLSYTWSKVSGPGTVVFASVNNPVTSATFSASGVYVLQLAASDGALTSTSTTTVWAEMPPTVNAGSDQTVALNATVNLAGTASDDNLPAGSALAYTWRTVTVPTGATVAFGTGTALSTTATGFTVAGNYVLALDVSDTVFTTRDTVTITVGSPNTPPTVTAGAVPAFVYETWPVNLTCTASDPDAGDVLTYAWTQTAGKTVSLSGAATPGASFTVPSLTLFVDSPMAFQIAVTDGKSPAVMASMTVNAYMMGDITHDGYVNVGDLQGLVAAWGGHASGLAADINGDTYVNVGDLQNLVANWGRSLH